MILRPENHLPHSSPMCLIDSILEVNEKSVHCQALITESNVFYDPAICGIYAWMGIEFMAQTAAVFAHFQNSLPSRKAAEIQNAMDMPKPSIGFLISVRKFSCVQSHFKLNDLLTIVADNEYLQDNIGVFQCSIILNSKLVASAKLNALQPSLQQLEEYIAK